MRDDIVSSRRQVLELVSAVVIGDYGSSKLKNGDGRAVDRRARIGKGNGAAQRADSGLLGAS